MPRITLFSAVVLLAAAAGAAAQHYDPYYVLPSEAGRLGAEVAIFSRDGSALADSSLVPVVLKYALTNDLEVGARANLGILDAVADDLSSVEVGVKYGLFQATAIAAAALLPVGDADDAGLSLGLMHSLSSADMLINTWVQVGLLDGYTGGAGTDVALLVEPAREIGDRLTAYLDLQAETNTDDIGDHLAVSLAPNIDVMFSQYLVVNVGASLGVAGDRKQEEVGVLASVHASF